MDLFKKIFNTKATNFWPYTLVLLFTFLVYALVDENLPVMKNFWIDLIVFMVIFYIFYLIMKIIIYFYNQKKL
ncbi:hypothetical protein ACFQ22_02630 [Lentilactobacillus raoultii]|uniref:Uncharacterized protein n=1 Tax=Lentilactobacillus raoultii TaxID=1987503 RepID=A0ABW3PPK6_9LACO|nr:hypothetical protein [Lentilactobacillus raoultii]